MAKGAPVVGRSLADLGRRERDGERSAVGEHMRRVRQKREAVEHERTDQFGDQEQGGQRQRDDGSLALQVAIEARRQLSSVRPHTATP